MGMTLAPNILIGGASCIGKTTLADALGSALGRVVYATDRMGRHPGRPWPEVRPHVAEYYAHLSGETIFTLLLHHHETMWPGIEALLDRQRREGAACIVEGAAIRPEFTARLRSDDHIAVFLFAPPDVLAARIDQISGYEGMSARDRILVDTFRDRCLRENDAIRAAAEGQPVTLVDASDEAALHDLTSSILGSQALP